MKNMTDIPYFLKRLNDEFELRKSKNRRYSLRSFALFLGVNPGTLSGVLKGKRLLPGDKIEPVAIKLKLSGDDRKKFLKSLNHHSKNLTDSFELSSANYDVLYEQSEYFVILALFRVDGFQSSSRWISRKTDIPVNRVQECLDNLMSLGLISSRKDGRLERTYKNLHSTHEVPSKAIRASQKNTLKMSLEKIDSVPPENRDYSFMTVCLDKKSFATLKKMILKFRDQVFELDENSKHDRLYRIAVQLYPLTEE